MLCTRCGSKMLHEVGKFMRTDNTEYVFHVYACEHCGMKNMFRKNIERQPDGNRMLCDQCHQELNSEQQCGNRNCSEFSLY